MRTSFELFLSDPSFYALMTFFNTCKSIIIVFYLLRVFVLFSSFDSLVRFLICPG